VPLNNRPKFLKRVHIPGQGFILFRTRMTNMIGATVITKINVCGWVLFELVRNLLRVEVTGLIIPTSIYLTFTTSWSFSNRFSRLWETTTFVRAELSSQDNLL
jgi:hypothetical protein